jgi:hypothetical protein
MLTSLSRAARPATLVVQGLVYQGARLDNDGAEGDLMKLNGGACPQMLRRHGASARNARARRHCNHIMGHAT